MEGRNRFRTRQEGRHEGRTDIEAVSTKARMKAGMECRQEGQELRADMKGMYESSHAGRREGSDWRAGMKAGEKAVTGGQA